MQADSRTYVHADVRAYMEADSHGRGAAWTCVRAHVRKWRMTAERTYMRTRVHKWRLTAMSKQQCGRARVRKWRLAADSTYARARVRVAGSRSHARAYVRADMNRAR